MASLLMLRAATATLALSLLTLSAACSSDEKSADTTEAPEATADDDEAAPAGEEADDTTAAVDTAAPDTTEAPETTTVETPAVTEPPATDPPVTETTGADTTDVDVSIVDSTDFVDDTDVIDDTVFDTFPEATDLPPVPTGSDVTTELCDTLTVIYEWFGAFEEQDEETTPWEELQEFDREETPRVLAAYADLAEQLPELADAVDDATDFTERLSEIIQTADSYDEGSEMLEEEEGEFEILLEQGLALEAISDYAEEECILAD